MSETKRTCTTCQFCLREDAGYSNYTVTETYLACLKRLNPALDGNEEPYGEPSESLAAALDVALTCPSYTEGTPAWLDVDREDIPWTREVTVVTVEMLANYTDNPEARELLAARLNNDG